MENFKIQVETFWLVTLRAVMVGYKHFEWPCCLHYNKTLFIILLKIGMKCGRTINETRKTN